jgi:hypothetical protein
MSRIANIIGDVAYVLNEWLDRRVRTRNINDALAVGILVISGLLIFWAAIIAVYGTREYNHIYNRLRPSLIPTLAVIVIIGDFLFLRQYKHAKARMTALPEDESRRCQSRAWRLLKGYFVLTIASIVFLIVAILMARHKGPR